MYIYVPIFPFLLTQLQVLRVSPHLNHRAALIFSLFSHLMPLLYFSIYFLDIFGFICPLGRFWQDKWITLGFKTVNYTESHYCKAFLYETENLWYLQMAISYGNAFLFLESILCPPYELYVVKDPSSVAKTCSLCALLFCLHPLPTTAHVYCLVVWYCWPREE